MKKRDCLNCANCQLYKDGLYCVLYIEYPCEPDNGFWHKEKLYDTDGCEEYEEVEE